MSRVILGLGSNVGNRLLYLRQAVDLVVNIPGLTFVTISPVYETEPVGYFEQADFLNAVAELNFEMAAEDLLSELQEIERTLGREREIRWGPRTIDIDILAIDALYYNSPRLKVPHPELANRLFVLQPFDDIAADYPVFALGKTVHRLLEMTTDRSKIKFYLSSQALLSQPKEV